MNRYKPEAKQRRGRVQEARHPGQIIDIFAEAFYLGAVIKVCAAKSKHTQREVCLSRF